MPKRNKVSRRGAPTPPKPKKRARSDRVRAAAASAGFESLAGFYAGESPGGLLHGAVGSVGGAADAPFEAAQKSPIPVTPREGFLLSMIMHLLLLLVFIVKPDLLAPSPSSSDAANQTALRPEERLVMVLPPPAQLLPKAAQPAPAPAPPSGSAILIPKATEPPPPGERQDFQNDLPFSKGNSDEFATDKENKKPGEEGKPAVPSDLENEPPGLEPEGKVADLWPGRLIFRRPDPARPRPADVAPPPDPGRDGEGGAFQDLRRFLRDKQFHNPEGGLLTGNNNTLYFNDKGANFVPWIRRMLTEVRRNWIVPYSAAYQAGHIAVGVSVLGNGEIAELKVLAASGSAGLDNAAVGALKASKLLPLPADYPDPKFDFILVFWYNERPYDIF